MGLCVWMHMGLCVCMHVCVCIFLCVSIWVDACVCACGLLCYTDTQYLCVCVCVFEYVCVCVCICVCVNVCVCIFAMPECASPLWMAVCVCNGLCPVSAGLALHWMKSSLYATNPLHKNQLIVTHVPVLRASRSTAMRKMGAASRASQREWATCAFSYGSWMN